MTQLVFNIGFLLEIISFMLFFFYLADHRDITTSETTNSSNGKAVCLGDGNPSQRHEKVTEEKESDGSENFILKISFLSAFLGFCLMWYAHGLP